MDCKAQGQRLVVNRAEVGDDEVDINRVDFATSIHVCGSRESWRAHDFTEVRDDFVNVHGVHFTRIIHVARS